LNSFSNGCEDGVSSQLTTVAWGSIVIRTIWIAAFCLACLGGLFATRVTASSSEEAVPDPITIGTSFGQDTLTKADRLDVRYLRDPIERAPVAPAEPVVAEIQPTEPPATAKAGSSHPQGLGARRIAVLLPKPRPKIKAAKNAKEAGLAKTAVDQKTCHQQDGLGGLLISLSGSPRCEL
jgi:hypothetical protein